MYKKLQLTDKAAKEAGSRNMRKILMFTVLTVLFTACSDNGEAQDGAFDFEAFFTEFQAQKAAWKNLNINDYMFVCEPSVRRDGYIPMWNPPLTIRVFPDKTPEITAIDVWAIGELPEWLSAEKMADLDYLLEVFDPPPTITQIYSDIEREIQSNRPYESLYIAAYEILYNKNYHFPECFDIHYVPSNGGGTRPGKIKITAFEDL